jgi:hypothetical protein
MRQNERSRPGRFRFVLQAGYDRRAVGYSRYLSRT